MYQLTSVGVKVDLFLLNSYIINDSQQLKGSIRRAHSKLLGVLLGIPVETTHLNTFNGGERTGRGE